MGKYETKHGNNTCESIITCKCPRCGKLHNKLIFYTGNEETPRFFCNDCKKNEFVFDNLAYDPTLGTSDKHGKNFRRITTGKS